MIGSSTLRGRPAMAVVAALVTAGLCGCGGTAGAPPGAPDPGLTATLRQVPTVSLRGPDNPTLDPRVLSDFWDSARVRAATPQVSAPRPVLPAPRRPAPPPGRSPTRRVRSRRPCSCAPRPDRTAPRSPSPVGRGRCATS